MLLYYIKFDILYLNYHHYHLKALPCRDGHVSLSFATFLSCG